mmetsp:Transcript_22308/g.50445  ORF Transcript_22308/g.50445 Transcript_22308/m.50445 type:complete len:235 (+) Transcript_22308:45-749(+)
MAEEDEPDPNIERAFMFAKYGEYLEFKALRESATPVDPKAVDSQGFTYLIWSARNGHTKMTNYLLGDGADKESACSHGLRAMHHACNNNREAVVDILIESKCELNPLDDVGNTPLIYAASRGILNLVNALVAGGADPKATNKNGQTALHKAVIGGHIGIVRRLIELKLDMDQQDKEGNTPVHFAARTGHLMVFKLLLESKGRVDINNKDGKSPFAYAQEYKALKPLVVKEEAQE